LPGEFNNHRVYVLQSDLGTTIAGREQNPWSRLDVPTHTSMTTMLDDTTRELILVIGTNHGRLLRYSPTIYIDHVDGSGTLRGTATSATSMSLTVAGATFETIGAGLHGAVARITWNGVTYERVVIQNTETTLYWIEAILGLGAGASVVVGAFDSYWSSPWLSPQKLGSFLHVEHVDFEFTPEAAGSSGSSTMDFYSLIAASAQPIDRPFDIAAATLKQVELDKGWSSHPERLRADKRGRYYRLRFGTSDPQQRFEVTSYGLRLEETGQRGGRTP
jgi:hypothetical protein